MTITGNRFPEELAGKVLTYQEFQAALEIKTEEKKQIRPGRGNFNPHYPWSVPNWVIRKKNSEF